MSNASSNRPLGTGHSPGNGNPARFAPSPLDRQASSNSRPSTNSRPSILGIWRLGEVIHTNLGSELAFAQPADALGSPRWDYVLKRALEGDGDVEARRQITQFVVAATAVAHPNLIPMLDASVTASSPYLVMPKIEGQTMQSLMTSPGSIPLPVALWFVRQIAQAVDALHQAGWIHGDIKPENVIVGARGHVTVIDLGFAARIHTVSRHRFRGTPEYSSPEAIAGQMAAMPAMDVFSLGRILWKWLTCIEQVNQASIEPVAGLVESMVSEDDAQRPSALSVSDQLLRLEIESLGCHIGPGQRRAA